MILDQIQIIKWIDSQGLWSFEKCIHCLIAYFSMILWEKIFWARVHHVTNVGVAQCSTDPDCFCASRNIQLVRVHLFCKVKYMLSEESNPLRSSHIDADFSSISKQNCDCDSLMYLQQNVDHRNYKEQNTLCIFNLLFDLNGLFDLFNCYVIAYWHYFAHPWFNFFLIERKKFNFKLDIGILYLFFISAAFKDLFLNEVYIFIVFIVS